MRRIRSTFNVPVAVLLAALIGTATNSAEIGTPTKSASESGAGIGTATESAIETLTENDVAVRMRDGIILRADIFRPAGRGRFPVLVYRTPYGKDAATESYDTHLKAVERGYAVVLQDVRGRYASEGEFNPYRNEGRDGYDTIEWVAAQSWSNGAVGTYGLSYPGAVQWLAAMESPPHLKAMAPAMTFSSPRHFFYTNGIFDLSWLPWIYQNVAPDRRVRQGLPGITTAEEAGRIWSEVAQEYRSWLPLRDLPYLRKEAPFYFEWLEHPPEDAWWNWAELRGRYARVNAAVLNLSGWFDESYGPEGAVTNFTGLRVARKADADARTHLMLGAWTHGVYATMSRRAGDIDFGPAAAIDYEDVILDFFDHHLRGIGNVYKTEPPVRYFVMGENRWRTASKWPPDEVVSKTIYLQGTNAMDLRSTRGPATNNAPSSTFAAEPRNPVVDPHDTFGTHDYQALTARTDLLTFDTKPLREDVTIAGAIAAVVHASCDCRDFDLWVRVQEVWPDGRAMNLMSPGNDVVRASYRAPEAGRQLLVPGQIYELRLSNLLTANRFAEGHRLRVQISASFAPHFSTNLQTGESEIVSAESRTATITIHHDSEHRSRLVLPVLPPGR